MKKKLFALIVFMATLLCAVPVMAEDEYTDTSGNLFAGNDYSIITSDVDNELFLAGQNIGTSGIKVDGSAFLAGYDIKLDNSNIGGTVFAAGNSITIDSDVKNNIFAAGNNISISEESEGKAVYAVGNSINVNGHFKSVFVAGNMVCIDGVVDGDVNVDGNLVVIGQNADIKGKLNIVASEDPEIADGASISDIEVKINKGNEDEENGSIVLKKAAEKTIGRIFLKKMGSFIYWSLAYILLAFVFNLFISKQMENSVDVAYERPLAVGISGLVGMICIPIIMILMCITVIGLPLAGLTGIIYATVKCFSVVFTFATIVRDFVFTHINKRLNVYAELALSVIIAALLKQVPFIGGLMKLACFVYALGYVIQAGYKVLSDKKAEKANQESKEETVA